MSDARPTPLVQQEDVLRATFVEMLFALAASDVAVHTAEVIQAPGTTTEKLPALAHLTLGLLLIAASWVGWRLSLGMKTQVRDIISLPFLGLLVDVSIVIIYFVLIRYVEVRMQDDEPVLKTASAIPESTWILVVFGVYMFWDLISDVFSPGAIPDGRTQHWPNAAWRAALVSIFASLVAAALCVVVRVMATDLSNYRAVILLDVALIAVVILFRLLKLCENQLALKLEIADLRAFSTKRQVLTRHWVAGFISGIAYLGAIMGACVI